LTFVRLSAFLARGKGNSVASLFIIVLSCWILKEAYTMGLGALHSPGPGFMVFIAAFLLAILALHTLFRSLARRHESTGGAPARKHRGRVVWVFLLLSGYVVLLNVVGYLLVTVVTLFLLFVVLQDGKKRWLSAAIMAAVTSAVTHLVFSVWFKLHLPNGWISWW